MGKYTVENLRGVQMVQRQLHLLRSRRMPSLQLHQCEKQDKGVLSKLQPIRPQSIPDRKTWLTAGAKGLLKGNGRFYHEVWLGDDFRGPQLGWLTEQFVEGDYTGEGVGDDEHGWAADGQRHMRWHCGGTPGVRWPRDWCSGDVIGCALDIEVGIMKFSLAGEWVENAEMRFSTGGHSYFPAVSIEGLFEMHIPRETWQFAPPDDGYEAWA